MRYWILFALLIPGVVLLPFEPVAAQPCGAPNPATLQSPFLGCPGAARVQSWPTTVGQNCMNVMGTRVFSCTLSNGFLMAAFCTGYSPMGPFYCSATCTCGTIRLDGSTGLPVELMSFSVESDDSASDADAEESEPDPDA